MVISLRFPAVVLDRENSSDEKMATGGKQNKQTKILKEQKRRNQGFWYVNLET